MTLVPIFVGTCDLESLVASGHKKIWRPPAANMGFCDFKDVVAFGNNQLWRPLAAKVKVHHSGLSNKMVSIQMIWNLCINMMGSMVNSIYLQIEHKISFLYLSLDSIHYRNMRLRSNVNHEAKERS